MNCFVDRYSLCLERQVQVSFYHVTWWYTGIVQIIITVLYNVYPMNSFVLFFFVFLKKKKIESTQSMVWNDSIESKPIENISKQLIVANYMTKHLTLSNHMVQFWSQSITVIWYG